MEMYPNECYVAADVIQHCKLSADDAKIHFDYTNDVDFSFQEFYYNKDSEIIDLYGGDFESVQRSYSLGNPLTIYYSLYGNGTYRYIEYHEKQYYLELRGVEENIREYVWYDFASDEFIQIVRQSTNDFLVTYFKDGYYVSVEYIPTVSPSWTYEQLGAFDEDGNKKVNYNFIGDTVSGTMYSLLYLDGWDYVEYKGARKFAILNGDKEEITEIFDANQIYIENNHLSLEDYGLSLTIDVPTSEELKQIADNQLLNVLGNFGIHFSNGELEHSYIDLISIQIMDGLQQRD
jgi:hypothetical protein